MTKTLTPDEIIAAKRAKEYAVKTVTLEKKDGNDPATILDVDTTKRIVTGLYNTALYFDSDYDVILPGANKKSIEERGPASNATQKIKHLMDHEWNTDKMPGRITLLEERKVQWQGREIHGTYFEMQCSKSRYGDDVLINYQEKIYDNHSEGFRYMAGEFVEKGSDLWDTWLPLLINPEDAEAAGFMFIWSELKMYEGSTVAFGANSLTPYLGVKSMNKDALLLKLNGRMDLLTKQLRDGKQTDECMQQFEMQASQIKQMMAEIFTLPLSEKDTLIKGRQANDTEKGLNINSLLNCF